MRRAEAVTSLLVAFCVIQWFLPEGLVWPVHWLVSFVHEGGHCLVALATGGQVEGFVVLPTGGGIAATSGGLRWAVLCGGYLGTAVAGSGLLVLNQWRWLRGRLLAVLGVGVLGLALALAGSVFTLAYGVAVACALLAVAVATPPRVQLHVVTFLGLLIGLEALVALRDLLAATLGLAVFEAPDGLGHSLSDAHQLARLTGVPAGVWVVLWSLTAGLMLWAAVSRVARGYPSEPISSASTRPPSGHDPSAT